MTADASHDPLLTATETADRLGIPVDRLYQWRSSGRYGGGPAAIKPSRTSKYLRFRASAVDAWLDEHSEQTESR